MTDLKREAERLTKSSVYKFGDAGSFSVPVSADISLPGGESPFLYLDNMGCSGAGRVLVVGPANGGLVAACIARGASEVVAVEHRHRFHGVIREVMALLSKVRKQDIEPKDTLYRVLEGFPGDSDWSEQLGLFDLIIWADGVSEITEPKRVLAGLASCLRAGGKAYIEVYHGPHGLVDRINSWRPTSDAMLMAAREYFGGKWLDKIPARRDNGQIYVATVSEDPVEETRPEPVELVIEEAGETESEIVEEDVSEADDVVDALSSFYFEEEEGAQEEPEGDSEENSFE